MHDSFIKCKNLRVSQYLNFLLWLEPTYIEIVYIKYILIDDIIIIRIKLNTHLFIKLVMKCGNLTLSEFRFYIFFNINADKLFILMATKSSWKRNNK